MLSPVAILPASLPVASLPVVSLLFDVVTFTAELSPLEDCVGFSSGVEIGFLSGTAIGFSSGVATSVGVSSSQIGAPSIAGIVNVYSIGFTVVTPSAFALIFNLNCSLCA